MSLLFHLSLLSLLNLFPIPTYDPSPRSHPHSYDGKVEHYRVCKHQRNWVTVDDEEYFENLVKLVEHYEKDADGLCCRLKHSIDKTSGNIEYAISVLDFVDSKYKNKIIVHSFCTFITTLPTFFDFLCCLVFAHYLLFVVSPFLLSASFFVFWCCHLLLFQLSFMCRVCFYVFLLLYIPLPVNLLSQYHYFLSSHTGRWAIPKKNLTIKSFLGKGKFKGMWKLVYCGLFDL